MALQELTLIETKFYQYQGMYYLIKGDKLIQFDHDHWLDIHPGSEWYGSLQRRFKKQAPLSDSEGIKALEILMNTIKEICE